MFGFLTPFALTGLALLAIPLLLHLFKPRKVRQMPFSSLRWLRESRHRLSRRIRLHQVLLFLLRAAFLTLLVLALARPVLSLGGRKGPVERFVILDVSRSMSYKTTEEQEAPIEVGRRIAGQLTSHVVARDRTAVLLAGATARALTLLASDTGKILQALRTTLAGLEEADLSEALRLVGPMIGQAREKASVELYFITDNHVQNWSQGPIG